MTTETTGQTGKTGEKCAAMDCCTPQKLMEMMACCGEALKGECGPMLQKMMEKGCCHPQQK